MLLNLENPALIEDASAALVRSRVFTEQERASLIIDLARYTDPGFAYRRSGSRSG